METILQQIFPRRKDVSKTQPSQNTDFAFLSSQVTYDVYLFTTLHLSLYFCVSTDITQDFHNCKTSMYFDNYRSEGSKFASFLPIPRCWDAHKHLIQSFKVQGEIGFN